MSLNSQIADLILEKGRAQAQGAAASGQAWGSALSQIGQQVGGALAQQADPRYQMEQQQLKDAESAKKFQATTNGIISGLMKTNPDGSQVIDRAKAQELLAQNNVPMSMQTAAFKQLDDMDASVSKFKQSRIEHAADISHFALGMIDKGIDPRMATSLAVAYGKANGIATDDEAAPLVNGVASAGDNLAAIRPMLESVRSLAPKYKDENATVVLPGTAEGGTPATLVRKETGAVVATGPTGAPKPMNKDRALSDLASPTATPEQKATAQSWLDAEAKTREPRPIEEQLLEAVAKGDTAKADQIKQTLQTTAAARRDPAAQALAAELGGLRKEEAQARLDKMATAAKPLDVGPDVQTTGAGRKYIDLSSYSAGERDKAREAANASGAVAVSKEQANALQEIDNARMNQKSIMDQIGDLLPKDPTGRPLAAAGATLSKLFQTDEQKAAYNSWRTAAIQTLRATAGSKGLRINQAEIAQAIENDIPKLTDSIGTAKQKVANINSMLENAEKSILTRDRSSAAPVVPTLRFNPATGQAEPIKPSGGQ